MTIGLMNTECQVQGLVVALGPGGHVLAAQAPRIRSIGKYCRSSAVAARPVGVFSSTSKSSS